eukprot:CAMPEP_0197522102 /NCGR_PEP_ID=MMETSP1318-20131121/7289_1 /TAXON_ID=552666 /ORGANISM="Partenskyella glossopodia, Strain RCC365" /LENGTH=927 /DNA_ID=CAMNT_0043074343 /DNA_START=598 /DNA_END=3382 /DNA_ORIENTATION=-
MSFYHVTNNPKPNNSPANNDSNDDAPSWHPPDGFDPDSLVFPQRIDLDSCPELARVFAYNPGVNEVIATLQPNITVGVTCYQLQKQVECIQFPRLCEGYPQISLPVSYNIERDIVHDGDYIHGKYGISIYKTPTGRILIDSSGWGNYRWKVTANLSTEASNLLWTGFRIKYFLAKRPMGCPINIDSFARALDVEVPLLVRPSQHGRNESNCYELMGTPSCFSSRLSIAERFELGKLCGSDPSHLFCDMLPKWLNDTMNRNGTWGVDNCHFLPDGGGVANRRVFMHALDGGDALEIRSTNEFFEVRNPHGDLPLELGMLISHIRRLAEYERTPTRRPSTNPQHGYRRPTPAPTMDLWRPCKPIRVKLEECPAITPVALFLNHTQHNEVIICSDTPPMDFMPPPLGEGTTCGDLVQYFECMEIPGCPLSPLVESLQVENEKDIIVLSEYQVGRSGISMRFHEDMVEVYGVSWSPRASGRWGPALREGGTEERRISALVSPRSEGLLWGKDYLPKYSFSASNDHCSMNNLFSYGITHPFEGGPPVLALPSACVHGRSECFQVPYSEGSEEEISRICTEDPSNYWCARLRDWMTKVTESSYREISDECEGGGVAIVHWGRNSGKRFDIDSDDSGDVYWFELRKPQESPDRNNVTFEFIRQTFQVISSPLHPTRRPTFLTEKPSPTPSLAPTLSPSISNSTLSPSGTFSPTSSPTLIEVVYPAADNVEESIIEIIKLVKGYHDDDDSDGEEPTMIPWLIYLGAAGVFLVLCCILGLVVCCVKKCCDACAKSKLGYKRSSMVSEEDSMDEMMMELEDINGLADEAMGNPLEKEPLERKESELRLSPEMVEVPLANSQAVEVPILPAPGPDIKQKEKRVPEEQRVPARVEELCVSPNLEGDTLTSVIQMINSNGSWERVSATIAPPPKVEAKVD